MELCLPLESFRGSQAPCRAVCGTCGCFQKMHGGVSAPSFCAFPHRVAFKEVSGHWVHFKSGPGNRGRLACGTTHVAHLEFPRETSIILRCAGKARNTFHTKQGNRLSCRYQAERWGSDEVVPGPSVFPSREPGVSGNFWGSHEGCHVPFHTSGWNVGLLLRCCSGQRASSCDDEGSTWFFSSCGGILELRRGIQASSCVGPGSLIFHSSCQGELGIGLHSLKGKLDLI